MRAWVRSMGFAGLALLGAGCLLPAYEVDESLGGGGGGGGNLPELPPPPQGCGGTFSGGPEMVPVRGGYCIDKTEVTWRQYSAWLTSLALDMDKVLESQPPECAWNDSLVPATSQDCQPTDEDQPVFCVDWCDAFAFCQSAGKRLCGRITGGDLALQDHTSPGVSQWMNACSSGGKNAYPYGDAYQAGTCHLGVGKGQPDAVMTASDCQSSDTQYAGVYDLSGNVSEWENSCNDKVGVGDNCLARGGSFKDGSDSGACGTSRPVLRQQAVNHVGFRCCWDAP